MIKGPILTELLQKFVTAVERLQERWLYAPARRRLFFIRDWN